MKTITVMAWIVVAAFLYKVGNERQMTLEYRGQRLAQERIADYLESRTNVQTQDDYMTRVTTASIESTIEYGISPMQLPTLGGTAVERAAR